jgi:hypothetical protein
MMDLLNYKGRLKKRKQILFKNLKGNIKEKSKDS